MPPQWSEPLTAPTCNIVRRNGCYSPDITRETVHQSLESVLLMFSSSAVGFRWKRDDVSLMSGNQTKDWNILRTLTDWILPNQTLLPLLCIKFSFLFYRECLKAAQQALSVTEFMVDVSGKPPLMLTSVFLSNTASPSPHKNLLQLIKIRLAYMSVDLSVHTWSVSYSSYYSEETSSHC